MGAGYGYVCRCPLPCKEAGTLRKTRDIGRKIDTMGLSIEELESQSSECLPAREVMTLLGSAQGPSVVEDLTKELYSQDALGGIALNADVDHVQVGLVNVQVDDVLNNNNLFTGQDNDVLDVLNGSFNGKDNDILDLGLLNGVSKGAVG